MTLQQILVDTWSRDLIAAKRTVRAVSIELNRGDLSTLQRDQLISQVSQLFDAIQGLTSQIPKHDPSVMV